MSKGVEGIAALFSACHDYTASCCNPRPWQWDCGTSYGSSRVRIVHRASAPRLDAPHSGCQASYPIVESDPPQSGSRREPFRSLASFRGMPARYVLVFAACLYGTGGLVYRVDGAAGERLMGGSAASLAALDFGKK